MNFLEQAARIYKNIHATPLQPVARAAARITVNTCATLQRFELPASERYTYYRYVLDMYEPGTTMIIKRLLKPGRVAVDIGAHVGYYTRLFARLVGKHGKVYAFEPDPETFAILQRNTRMFSNVCLRNMAALDREMPVALYESPGQSGRNSIWESNVKPTHNTVVVPAGPLDKVLTDVSPQLVKVDVEGSESEALYGMTKILSRSRDVTMIVEYNPRCLAGRGLSPKQLVDTIQSRGFRISSIDEATGKVEDIQRDLEPLLERAGGYFNLLCTR